ASASSTHSRAPAGRPSPPKSEQRNEDYMQQTAHDKATSTPIREPSDLHTRLDGVIRRSQSWCLGAQKADGFWHAPLEANASMDAQFIIFNRFMGRRPVRVEARIVDHMLSTQSNNGSWPLYAGGPGHVSVTIEAYFALKLAVHAADE